MCVQAKPGTPKRCKSNTTRRWFPTSSCLDVFWSNHNPTQLNRQGGDKGSQYRSAIFFHTPEQQEIAQKSKADLEASGRFKGFLTPRSIVTEITPAETFTRAEEYHQQFLAKRGQTTCHL